MSAAAQTTTRDGLLHIGAVCNQLRDEFPDVSISKIRYLEDQGLIHPKRTRGGYRLFDDDAVERLRTILRLQRDEFLPLRVIRQELASPEANKARRRRRAAGLAGPEEELSAGEIEERSGATPQLVRELEEYGLLEARGSGGEKRYSAGDTEIAAVCAQLASYGIAPTEPARVPDRGRPRGVSARAARRAVAADSQPRASRSSARRPPRAGRARAGAVAAALVARPPTPRIRLMAVADVERLKSLIRDVPDWPEPGVVFKDIMPLLANADALRELIDVLGDWAAERTPDIVVGAEARGFFVGSAIAYKLGCGFVPARRPGKLPLETISAEYALEYGKNTLELRADAFGDGARVLIHDDVLATGGTAKALAELVEQLGGEVVGLQFIIELDFLKGLEKISGYDVFSLIHY